MTKALADRTAISDHAAARVQRANVTEIGKLEGRGHALTIDHGGQGVAETALNFVSRLQPTTGGN
jgi:hypothetical protein